MDAEHNTTSWRLYLLIPLILGAAFVLVILLADTARNAMLLLVEVIFALVVQLNNKRLGRSAAIHLLVGSLCIYQLIVMELNRDLIHIGVVWFLLPPVYVALFGRKQHVFVWGPLCLLAIFWVAYRASPQDLLWQHPLTLINVSAVSIMLSLCAYYVLLNRDRREQSMREALATAQSAERARARFLAIMSHELRTPLMTISNAADLLESDGLSDNQQSMRTAIRQGSDALVKLFNHVLDLARMEAGQFVLREEQFDLLELSEDVCRWMVNDAALRGNRLLLDLSPNLPRYWYGEPTQLRQILVNLLSNAIKNTRDGWLLVRLREERGLSVEVSDTGVGMSSEQLEQIFEPYTQLSTSDSQEAADSLVGGASIGSGLGLSIVKALLDTMGGDIETTSKPGRGSRFWLRLPFEKRLDERVGDHFALPERDRGKKPVCSLSSHQPWCREWQDNWLQYWQIDTKAAQERDLAVDLWLESQEPLYLADPSDLQALLFTASAEDASVN
ncbi:MAG: ATP-binding protein [Pseudomonadaceae bacterium]|nr:ATP-binding protein [Pseudomonadaceae bacterium]